MIVSAGEVVWDIFAGRQVLGGAPINVAYHLNRLGLATEIVTRIGRDKLGAATVVRLKELGLPLGGLQYDADLPTGRVNVTVDAHNEPHFDIVAPAAWDNIDSKEAARLVGGKPFGLVFGTLAQRDPRSREAIMALARQAETRFYDVNLRPPFTTRELVLDSLALADLAKMNGHELATVAGWLEIGGPDKKSIAQALCKRYDLQVLAVTEGANGAWLLADGDFFSDPGSSVAVVDTVGAGDAFFSALIAGFVRRTPWPETLARANRRGGYVAGQRGATPAMPDDL